MSSESEDYWSESLMTRSVFEYEDENDVLFDINIPSSNRSALYSNDVVPSTCSISTLISKNNLDLLLDDVQPINDILPPSHEDVIKAMCYGQKHTLETYRSLEDKLKLLDLAINTLDGNVIIEVVLFLKQTLKSRIFVQELRARKTALRQFLNYLIATGQLEELTNLFSMLGNALNYKELYYFITKDGNPKTLLMKTEQFMTTHLQELNHDDKQEISDRYKFLQWQVDKHQDSTSVIDQLSVLCRNTSTKDIENMNIFRTLLKIDSNQSDWTIMNTLASMSLWKRLLEDFTKLNWLSRKTALKSSIDPEVFLLGLGRHQAPCEIVEKFLPCVADADRMVYVAEKLRCFKFLFQYYVQQKDRQSLLLWKSKFPEYSSEHRLIDESLRQILSN